MRLKDRSRFCPGGFRYYVPETKWSISPWISFDAAVAQIIKHRQGNPFLVQSKNWSLDPFVVADELDAFNAAVCQQMRWNDYITEGGPDTPIPKAMSASPSSRAGRLAAGVQTIADWEIGGGMVVERDLANARAKTCSTCPLNEQGDLLQWFTQQAARLIQLQLETRNNMKLYTHYDPILGCCSACGCVNKLSVWCPLDIKLKHMKPDAMAALHPACWVLSEQKK